ncbi:hypothetical protein MUN74_10195 [Agromyces endophyticus]|uniref:hypothetical protein n=1 Tax=Agromyces sp. H17E-10 TaxID=2932244 RepID=UPI001FD11AC5|nr:hypothetical protein [Agromyces sp. H17E-10]UOQ87680.1 hypothetical protein MUN74_10195 [Agromyces sp. H17E-10]
MRKVLLLCAAMAVLVVGSAAVGVAAARTGAPVLYDARVQSGATDDLAAESRTESPPAETGGDGSGGAADSGEAGTGPGRGTAGGDAPGEAGSSDRPRAHDDARRPLPGRTTAPTAPTEPTPAPGTPPGDTGRATAVPTPTPAPADPEPSQEEQATWLAFQQLVRDCMTEAGHEYRHWKWWEAESPDPESLAPAMPEQLTAAEQAAWREALYGTESDEGCLVVAVQQDRDGAPQPPGAPDAVPETAPGTDPSPAADSGSEASASPEG